MKLLPTPVGAGEAGRLLWKYQFPSQKGDHCEQRGSVITGAGTGAGPSSEGEAFWLKACFRCFRGREKTRCCQSWCPSSIVYLAPA